MRDPVSTRSLCVLGLAAVCTGLLGVASTSGWAAELPRVVVVRTRQASAYDEALEGVRQVLGSSSDLVVIDVEPGDPAQQADRVREADLVLPLGSQATSWVLERTESLPIVFALVLNPVSSALIDSMNRPGKRITGAALDIPLSTHFEALHELVEAKRVAVLYNPENTRKVIEAARLEARKLGIELVPIKVSSPTDLDDALVRVDGSFDALWSVADKTVLSHGAVQQILLHSLKEKVPFIGLSEPYAKAGALYALSTSYEANGRQAAQLALRVLGGEAPGHIPVAVPAQVEVVFNPLTASRLAKTIRPDSRFHLRSLR